MIDFIKFMLSYRRNGEKRKVNMDRLTKNNREDNKGDYYYPECFERCDGFGTSEKCDECDFCYAVCEKLGKYEDMEEQVVERLKEASYERFGNDGMGIAIQALEKQIPKKPTYEGDGYAPDGTFVLDEWICPCCGKRYKVDYDDYDYCPNCGQKIDWSDEK